jgi:hypothetical protein
MQVLEGYGEDGKANLLKPTTQMTLRMLLNHTCGEYMLLRTDRETDVQV